MTRRIRRDDPEYNAAMREAKAAFDAAMAKGAMKGRGRPAAKPPAAPALTDTAEHEVAELLDALSGDTAEHEIPAPLAPEPAAPAAPERPKAKRPVKKKG